MRGAKISLIVVSLILVAAVVWKPVVSRGQAHSLPVSTAGRVQPALATRVPRWVPAISAGRIASSTSDTVSAAAISVAPFDIDARPLTPRQQAAGYPMPERRYIASGLWEVGITELGRQYHAFDCPVMKRSSRNHIYGFPTWEEALVAGYQPHLSCTAPPLGKVIEMLRDARRKVTQRGQPPSTVSDTELERIRTEAGAESVSEKVLNHLFMRMLGRDVNLPSPQVLQEQRAQQQAAQGGLGMGGGMEGLPPGEQMGGAMGGGAMGSGMGGGMPMGSGMSGGSGRSMSTS